jgi:hypothetical protein
VDLKTCTICCTENEEGATEFAVAFLRVKQLINDTASFKPINERI